MSGGSNLEHIDAVDAFARNLYLLAKQSGPSFEHVATAVRQLHIVLRHLRVEAADPDSLLNSPNASVYGRQLGPMLEDCDFTLKTLDTMLEKFGNGKSIENEREVADRAAIIKSRLMGDRTNLDIFLDTVQLHNPANKPDRVVDGSQGSLEGIKDKVDEIATRLFQRRDGRGFAEDEDNLWQGFKAELEKEGFSPHVLRKHKDVLRAYIRELEFMSSANGGTCPTVRGLLEHEAKSRPVSPGKELAVIDENNHPHAINIEQSRSHHAVDRRYSTTSSEHSGSDSSESMALISTKELMAMDSLNASMSRFHLQPPGQDRDTLSRSAPTTKYLPSNVAGTIAGPREHELSASPTSHFGSSPRFVPPTPGYTAPGPQGPLGPNGGASRAYSRLAPDRYGNEIPVEAQWTRIKRTLVSPEVLERAGVRYEARPEYVAILGRLSKEQIAEFAHQSALARAARNYPRRHNEKDERRRSRSDSRSSEEDDDSDAFDESDSTDDDDDKTSDKGHKSYLHVVDPPDKKTSPSSTVPPKPILKNKENHVRFDPQPHDLESKSPHSLRDDRDHSRRQRPPPPGFRRHRDPPRRGSSDTSSRGDRYGGEYYHDNRSTGRRHHRDRERRGSRRDEREPKKKWGSALGAVGIGGAAATLLSVLAEAASVV